MADSNSPPILEWLREQGRGLSLDKALIREAQEELGPYFGLPPGVQPAYVFAHPGPYYLAFSEPGWRYFVDQHVDAFSRAGLMSGSVVDVAVSFHLVPAGLAYEQAVRRIGATVVPGGAGQHREHATALDRLGIDWLIGFGSFLEQVVGEARTGEVAGVIAVGEPVGRDSPLRRAKCFAQTYGTAEAGPVAVTCDHGNFHPIRPATVRAGEPAQGDTALAEILIDLPDRPDLPFDGFATGDYSHWFECPCRSGVAFDTPQRRSGAIHRSRGIFFTDGDVAGVLATAGYQGGFKVQVENVVDRPRLLLDTPTAVPSETIVEALRERTRLRFEVQPVR